MFIKFISPIYARKNNSGKRYGMKGAIFGALFGLITAFFLHLFFGISITEFIVIPMSVIGFITRRLGRPDITNQPPNVLW